MPCKFPEHHRVASSGGSGLLIWLVAAAAAAYLAVRLVEAAVAFVEAWWWTFALGLVVPLAAWVVVRLVHLGGASRPAGGKVHHRNAPLLHLPRAVWCAARWHALTRRAGLARADMHARDADRRRVLRPRARIWPAAYGVTARVRTCPGANRTEFEKAAEAIAAQWRVQRLAITEPRPGVLRLNGFARDPLTVPSGTAEAPREAYAGRDLTRLYVGRDEAFQPRWLQVRDNTAATVAGQPGSGKSVGINGLLLQWAPSPAAQFGTADGKSPVDGGDYEVWRRRAWRTCSDSREDTADMLSDARAIMRERLGRVEELTGSRNAWHAGPTPDFPLFGLVLDECQRYLDVTAAKRDKDAERLILQIQQMAADIVRQGRSVLMFLILATQRATVDSIPGQIRDNAALNLALAQKTMDASVAALGTSIRDYPSFAPTAFQDPAYTGCAVATMRSGRDPFTRLKLPGVTHEELRACAAATAHLRRDPGQLLPVVVPDTPAELVTS